MVVKPILEEHDGIFVVRDDLIPGGTKGRFAEKLFEGVDVLVYATPQEGGAQTALALAARRLNKRLVLFTAKRDEMHERVRLSIELGADVRFVERGYLSTVKAAAKRYASHCNLMLKNMRTRYLIFGLHNREILGAIAEAARLIPPPKELWCASGSGTVMLGLSLAWPKTPRFAVQVGHHLKLTDVGKTTTIIPSDMDFSEKEVFKPPFPSDPHYDAKAYRVCLEMRRGQGVTFWNVAGPAGVYRHELQESIMESDQR